MTREEFSLWERYGRGDEAARKELLLSYLPLVEVLAKRIARSTGANWEDLRQDGAIGLIKAISRFDLAHGVPFTAFAKHYIRGAIFDSSELTRDLARRQEEILRKFKQTEDELIQTLQRNPTTEEVAEKAELTIQQILRAIEAKGVAFAGAMPDAENVPASSGLEASRQERAIFLLEALSHLDEREQAIIRLYYWEDKSHEEIAQVRGVTVSNAIKIRQRAIDKLRKRLEVKRKGGHDEDRRSGK
jgi:RNA polymerase sigma factor (sigma-70 family)